MCDQNCRGMEVETVRHGARGMTGSADQIDDMATELGQSVQALRDGSVQGRGWSGPDADRFFTDFDAFLPSVAKVLSDHVRPAAERMETRARWQMEKSLEV